VHGASPDDASDEARAGGLLLIEHMADTHILRRLVQSFLTKPSSKKKK
jgi:hypothetical protein